MKGSSRHQGTLETKKKRFPVGGHPPTIVAPRHQDIGQRTASFIRRSTSLENAISGT